MQVARRLVPIAGINEIIPVRNLVVDRATRCPRRKRTCALTKRHPAIHAARGLGPIVLFRERQNELAPMTDALIDRLVVAVFALIFEKAGDFAHVALCRAPYSAACMAAVCALSSLRARRYSIGITLRNLGYQVDHSSRIFAATVE